MNRITFIPVAIFTLLMTISCNKSKSDIDYLNCLPHSKKEIVIRVNESFDRFIMNNFNNSLDEFIDYLIRAEDHSSLIFDNMDKELFVELESNLFHELAYKIEKIDLQKNKRQYSKSIQDKIDNGTYKNNWSTEVNIKRPYFKCLKQANDQNPWVEEYLKTISKVGVIQPMILAKEIKRNYIKDENDFTVKQILIMEYYYFKLKSKYNE